MFVMSEETVSSLSLSTKLIIVALILVVAALYYLYTNLEKFKVSVVNILKSLQNSEEPVQDEPVVEEIQEAEE